MPRRSKGPRLYLRAPRADRGAHAVWVIRDGQTEISTGCDSGGLGGQAGAEQALSDYIASKWKPPEAGRAGDPAAVLVVECLAFYSRLKVPTLTDPVSNDGWIAALTAWWGAKTLADVKMSTCGEYIAHRIQQPIKAARHGAALDKRVTVAGARRELELLSAAITFWAKEYPLSPRPIVSLPPKDESPRDALTRAQAARLLKASLGYRLMPDGRWRRLQRSSIANRAHLRRFILIALYTGTRPGVIPKLLWHESPTQAWVDLDAGVIYRRGKSERDHKTKRRPMVRLPARLLAHMRRWRALDTSRQTSSGTSGAQKTGAARTPPVSVLHHGGEPLAGRVRRGFERCVADAGLADEITPHWMRHTCATWLMEAGVPIWDAAAYTGMTTATLEKNYGHHRPDHQSRARKAFGG